MFITKWKFDAAMAALHSHIRILERNIMSATDDLKAEIVIVAADVLAAIAKFQAAQPPTDDPAVIQATADLKAAVKPLEDFVNPPAPPVATP